MTHEVNLKSAISFATMENAADFDGVRRKDEEEPIVCDAEPQFISLLERFYIALPCFGKTLQGGKNAQRRGLVQPTHIQFGRIGPDNPLHRILL